MAHDPDPSTPPTARTVVSVVGPTPEPDAPPDAPLGAGRVVGNYRLGRRLGEGGMGEVYQAVHVGLGTTVAVKLVHRERVGSADAARRFLREVRAAGRVDHPHVVKALDAGEDAGGVYLVMEYVDGRDLAAVVRQSGPLPPADAVRVGLELGLGLGHLHAAGLVHRDVKPSNLVRDGKTGSVKLLDLGLTRLGDDARGDSDSGTMTRHGAVLGTPDFIAPEQALDARRADVRSDLYSGGCTLFFLLTGSVPFPGGTGVEKLIRHHQEPPPRVTDLRPDCPPSLAAVVARLMAKNPADRYQTPTEFVQALVALNSPVTAPVTADGAAAFADLLGSGSVPAPAARRSWVREPARPAGPRRRRLTPIAAGLVGLAAAAAGLAVVLWPDRPPPPAAAPPAADGDPRRAGLYADWLRLRGTPDGVAAAQKLRDIPSPLDALPRAPFGVPAVLIGDPKRRHGGAAAAVAVTPDGGRAVSAGFDRAARVWDVAAGMAPRRTLTGHHTPLRTVAVSPAGTRAAACSGFADRDGGGDGMERGLRVWDTATGKELLAADHDRGGWTVSALFPPGERFVVGGQYAAVAVWDLDTGEKVRTLTAPRSLDWVNCLALSADGRLLFGGSNYTDQLHVWEYDGGKHVRILSGHDGVVHALAAAPDNRRLASAGRDGSVRVWDYVAGTELRRLTVAGESPGGVGWDPAGRELVATWTDGSVRWFDPDTGSELRRGTGHLGPAGGLAVGRGVVLTAGDDGSVRRWNPLTGREVDPLPPQMPPARVGFADADRAVAVAPAGGRPVRFDLPAGKPVGPGWAAAADWHPGGLTADGRAAVGPRGDGFVRWEVAAADPDRLPFRDPRLIRPWAVAPDAGRLLAVVRESNRLGWADLTATAPPATFESDAWVLAVSLSADGRRAAVGGKQGLLRVHDLAAGGPPAAVTLADGQAAVGPVGWSADGARVYAAAGGAVWAVPAAGGDPDRLGAVSGHPTCLTASADGRWLAVGTDDGEVALFPAAGRAAGRVVKAAWPVRDVAFSADGRGLAVGFGNGVVGVYRVPDR